MSRSIVAPSLPEIPPPPRFPVVALIAPVVFGVVMWLVTHMLVSVLFAALGPLIALAMVADGSIGRRRKLRTERARFAREVADARSEVVIAHDAERSEVAALSRAATHIVRRGCDPAEQWGAALAKRLYLGEADRASDVRIEGLSKPSRSLSPEQQRLAELASLAAILTDAACDVPITQAVAVIGVGPLAESLARAVAIQSAWLLSPADHSLVVDRGTAAWAWCSRLPHAQSDARGREVSGRLAFCRGDEEVFAVTLAAGRAGLDLRASNVIVVEGEVARLETSAGVTIAVRNLDRVSHTEAVAWATAAAARARQLDIQDDVAAMPARVALADLSQPATSPTNLAATIGRGPLGEIVLDLVRDGPHAVVGGTTGSGKSELLTSWILAMASTRSPDQLVYLLIDFKGGSSFAPLEALPHCVGVVTDLNPHLARRALESLEAEIRARERLLSESAARSIDEVPAGLPRLVIVVDEFATLLSRFPDLAALFTDLSARGRSLGIHLIVATQRPSGVVRDAFFANVGLRISLRVHDAADSTALIGSPDAARIAREAVGRALVSAGDVRATRVQWAISTAIDAHRIADLCPPHDPPRRPWLDELPATLPISDLPSPHAIGRLDVPTEQSQPTATWIPDRDGHALVLGTRGSGKSNAAAILAGPHVPVLSNPIAVWSAVQETLRKVRSAHREPTVLAIDDVDIVCERLSREHESGLIDAIMALLREGPSAGVALVMTATKLPAGLSRASALLSFTIVLRCADKHEHVLSGGPPQSFDRSLPPGRGWLNAAVLQLALAPASESPSESPPVTVVDFARSPKWVVVSRRAQHLAQKLRAQLPSLTLVEPYGGAASRVSVGTGTEIIMGDVDAWNRSWGMFASVTTSVPALIHACSTADYRSLTGNRDIPPPLDGDDECWLLEPGCFPRRAFVLDYASTSASSR